MALILEDNSYGTLASGLAAGDTALTFTAGHGARFPAVAAGDSLYCCLLNTSNVLEEIIVTAHTAGADTATISRAANGTTAKAWAAGDRIEARVSSEVLLKLQQEALKSVSIVTTDTGRTYQGTFTPAPLGLVTNLLYPLTITTSNGTSAPTIALNALSTATVKTQDGNALSIGQMPLSGLYRYDGTAFRIIGGAVVSLPVAVGDETTTITTGSAKVTFRMPHAMTLSRVKGSLTSVSTATGLTVDITHAGTSIFSTKMTFDTSESTTESAAVPSVLAATALSDDAIMTINVDGAGAAAKGLKVYLIGRP
jgi:hypothetical protein